MTNQCVQCEALLTVYADNDQVLIPGEIDCCCGDIDTDGNYYNASCVNCCPSQNGAQIWEGKSAGGGYYIVNPSN